MRRMLLGLAASVIGLASWSMTVNPARAEHHSHCDSLDHGKWGHQGYDGDHGKMGCREHERSESRHHEWWEHHHGDSWFDTSYYGLTPGYYAPNDYAPNVEYGNDPNARFNWRWWGN